MDSSECYRRYRSARMRFDNELEAIEKEYISSNYSFKKGDIVKIKDDFSYTTKLFCVERVYLCSKLEDERYKYPRVEVEVFDVDEEGYLLPFLKGGTSPNTRLFYPDKIIEVTSIKYKGLR